MRALFITTPTLDCSNHVRAWNSFEEPAEHFVFDHIGLRNDWQAVERAREVKPDIMFYIGPNQGRGVPRTATFIELRGIAPLVNLCSDAADKPWHKTLELYRSKQCFDLQVAIDGARDAPVDIATLTPIDPTPFGGQKRDIRCGFSGTLGGQRELIVQSLEWFGGLTVRRAKQVHETTYEAHAEFMSRCQIVLNTSYTGTGHAHHIKGRVLEAGWAGAALLEPEESPIGDWFPEDCFIRYRDPIEAAHWIKTLTDGEIDHRARRLTEEVMMRYTPAKIYGEILEHVGRTESIAAA